MKTAGLRWIAGLAGFALPLLAVAADDSAGTHTPLPRFAYQPPASQAAPTAPPPGTPYSAAAAAARKTAAVKMAPVKVDVSVGHTYTDLQQSIAAHERLESCALVKEELPRNRGLELFDKPEPSDGSFADSASFPLVRLRW